MAPIIRGNWLWLSDFKEYIRRTSSLKTLGRFVDAKKLPVINWKLATNPVLPQLASAVFWSSPHSGRRSSAGGRWVSWASGFDRGNPRGVQGKMMENDGTWWKDVGKSGKMNGKWMENEWNMANIWPTSSNVGNPKLFQKTQILSDGKTAHRGALAWTVFRSTYLGFAHRPRNRFHRWFMMIPLVWRIEDIKIHVNSDLQWFQIQQ